MIQTATAQIREYITTKEAEMATIHSEIIMAKICRLAFFLSESFPKVKYLQLEEDFNLRSRYKGRYIASFYDKQGNIIASYNLYELSVELYDAYRNSPVETHELVFQSQEFILNNLNLINTGSWQEKMSIDMLKNRWGTSHII